MNKRFALILILIAFFAAGCGAAAAPPVDLPAPVTGQIDVGTPDADGKSTITGTAGSVEGDSIVLAGNENLIETAYLWKITDALMKTAHAQLTLPEICERLGYACTISESDGSFTMTIDAVVGDSIFIVVIDSDGRELSPRSTFQIPSWNLSQVPAGCEGTSAYGHLVDVKNVGSYPLILFEGDGETGAQNKLQFGNGSQAQTVELPGCYAKQVTTYYMSNINALRIVVISSTDRILWSGILTANGLVGINTHVLLGQPLAATFVDDPTEILLAGKVGSTYGLSRVALGDGENLGNLEIPTPPTEETLNGIMGVKVLGPFADDGYLGAVVSKGVDGSSNNQFFMFFFDAKTFDVLSYSPNKRLGYESVGGGLLDPLPAHDLADFGLGYDAQTSGLHAVLLISDHGNHAAHKVALWRGSYEVSVADDTMSDLYAEKIFMDYYNGSDIITSATTVSPRRLALGVSSGTSMAYILTDENYMWKLEDYPIGMSAIESTWTIPGASDCTAISVKDPFKSIFVGDVSLGNAIDASEIWGSGS